MVMVSLQFSNHPSGDILVQNQQHSTVGFLKTRKLKVQGFLPEGFEHIASPVVFRQPAVTVVFHGAKGHEGDT